MSVPWNDDISSLKVKDGGCECFRDYGCIGRLFYVCNEDMEEVTGVGDETISSFRCYY